MLWRGHFLKQLSYTLSASCFLKPSAHLPRQPLPTPPLSRFFILPRTSFSAYFSSSSSTNSDFVSPYLSVRIRCPNDVADTLSEALLCFGANSAAIDEKDDNENSEETCIDSIFPEGHDVKMCILHAADSIGLKNIPSYEVKMGEQYDWIKKTQESFNPVEVTEGLWIVPEWRTPPDVQATNIVLNPGLAFGTGEHPTTKLCILLLRSLIKGGEHFLDYGTGSGILAIAAIKFGAAHSFGIDIDPQAIASAQQNAALNNVGPEKMQVQMAPTKSSQGIDSRVVEEQGSYGMEENPETKEYDIVVANILLNPLLDLAENIVSYAKPGAVVGLSGILSDQLPCIIQRYTEFLDGIAVTENEGWACVHGTRKEPLGDC